MATGDDESRKGPSSPTNLSRSSVQRHLSASPTHTDEKPSGSRESVRGDSVQETQPKENESTSPTFTRSPSPPSEKIVEPVPTGKTVTIRDPSPVVRDEEAPPAVSVPRRRTRSNSPRKTFSYLPPARLNLRKWKQDRRQLAKQDEDERIYQENRKKLERLAKIACETSRYPSVNVEQERLRERHARDHQRKIVKTYLPILRDNLCIVNRLANIQGVYDRKRIDEDYARHTQILRQDAANRSKARATAAQRPFILPRIHGKS
jgi:hypothetical protein